MSLLYRNGTAAPVCCWPTASPLKHIQEWLGHSDFTTTANIYAHLDYKSKITSAQAMETGLALPEGGDFSSRWGSIGAGENS